MPLERFARLFPEVNPDEFMWMGTHGGRIQLYKHGATRRYLNLDDAGHAYVYDGWDPNGGPATTYSPLPTPGEATAHLELDGPCNYYREEVQ